MLTILVNLGFEPGSVAQDGWIRAITGAELRDGDYTTK
jgi:hypothetical protein